MAALQGRDTVTDGKAGKAVTNNYQYVTSQCCGFPATLFGSCTMSCSEPAGTQAEEGRGGGAAACCCRDGKPSRRCHCT